MNFKNFLELKTYQTQAYQQDIQKGKEIESLISKTLETDCGFQIVASNEDLDRNQAIDTFIIKNGQHIPAQIKMRNNFQDDIGYEIAKNFSLTNPHQMPNPADLLRNLNGRDLKGSARMVINLSQDKKTLRMIDNHEGHNLIMIAVKNWLKFIEMAPNIKRNKWKEPNGLEILLKFDLRDSYWKAMAYIPSNQFKSLQICNLKTKLNI